MHVVIIGGWAPSLLKFRGPLIQELLGRGHRVTTAAPDPHPEIIDGLRRLGAGFVPISLHRAGLNPVRDGLDAARLARLHDTLRPDVLFTYTIKPVVYGQLTARLVGVPRRYAMITGLGYAFAEAGVKRRALRTAACLLYRHALEGADGLFLQNPDDRRDLEEFRALPPRLPVHMVRGSGVDVEHFAPAALPGGPLRCVFIGRLLREKGIVEFVEVARRVRRARPEIEFEVVGGLDPNPASVRPDELARWVAEGAITHAGEVADVRPYLARAHVLVLPSVREGTPRAVLEAMSMGRAVIVSDAPGCRETILDGVQGFIRPREPAALAAAILELARDPGRTAAMGREGRRRIEELYDARRVAAGMADVMER